MTTSEMTRLVGKQVLVREAAHGELYMLCDVLDAKSAYGNVRYLVRPVQGQGEAWVDSSRCAEADRADSLPLYPL